MKTIEVAEDTQRQVLAVSEDQVEDRFLSVSEDEASAPKAKTEDVELAGETLDLTDGRGEVEEELVSEQEEVRAKEIEVTHWETPKEFISYLRNKIQAPPQFPKDSIRGIERQIIFYDNLQGEISKAIKQDAIDGSLIPQELKELDNIDLYINGQIKGLERRKDKLGKALAAVRSQLKKKAYTPVPRLTVDPFLDNLVKRCINAKISSGKNIEEVFERLAKKYNLTEREKMAALNVLNAYGYPIRGGTYADDEMIEQYYA